MQPEVVERGRERSESPADEQLSEGCGQVGVAGDGEAAGGDGVVGGEAAVDDQDAGLAVAFPRDVGVKLAVMGRGDTALLVTPILTFPHQGGRDF